MTIMFFHVVQMSDLLKIHSPDPQRMKTIGDLNDLSFCVKYFGF